MFVHRVVSVAHAGGQTTLQTKGDINGSVDGWVLTAQDLTGQKQIVIPDLGFLLQMLPLLLLGSLVIALVTGNWRAARRGPLRVGMFSVLCSFLLYHFKPLTRVDLLTQTITNGHGRATLVPTGALPLRITATGGTHVDLTPGQLGMVVRDHLPPSGHFAVRTAIHLTGWWWLLVLVWLVPLAFSLRYQRQPAGQSDTADALAVESTQAAAGPENLTITLPGRALDLAACTTIRDTEAQVVAAGVHSVSLDLSQVKFIDASGVGAIIELNNRLAENGGTVHLTTVHHNVRRVLEMMDLSSLLVEAQFRTPSYDDEPVRTSIS